MYMKRRDFIKRSALASSALFVPNFLNAMDGEISIPKGVKRLLVIQLAGGNDGLNTLVPFTNDIYYRNRPTIAIKKKDVLPVNDTLGFHKNLKGIKTLYDQGVLSVVNNVGYPNPNRSHFRSSDIWHTASAADEYVTDGWIGRYLDAYGNAPHDAIEVGSSLSTIMKGATKNGIVTKDATLLQRIARDPYFSKVIKHHDATHLSEHNMGYLYQTLIDAKQSAAYIYEKSRVFESKFSYGNSQFGKQLKTISEFINSGLETKIYYASLRGFDTHANQMGPQVALLQTYDEAISTFVKDLKANGTFKDTLILTFSEFGRRVAENAAKGTDHGAANQVFIIGSSLRSPGLFNEPPDLSRLDANGDLIYDVDFRSIYANILEDWLDVSKQVVLGSSIPSLKIV
jgi:uncharacterized protein (DUF1501 family)